MSSFVFLLTGLIIGVILGVLGTIVFKAQEKPATVKPDVSSESDIGELESCVVDDPRIEDVRELVNLIKNKQKISCHCHPSIVKGLELIAQEPDWEHQIDNETLDILSQLNKKRKEALKNDCKDESIVKIDKENSRVSIKKKYWEGTPQQYEEALENGIIDENTIVEIIEDDSEYHGSWITHNADGSVEEFME